MNKKTGLSIIIVVILSISILAVSYVVFWKPNDQQEDGIAPTLKIVSPSSTITNEQIHLLNITASDNVGVEVIWYNWNGTKVIYTSPIEIKFKEGLNVLQACANDSSGNNVTSTFSFIVDLSAPTVKIVSPTKTVSDSGRHLLNIIATDNNTVSSIWYNWNGTATTFTSAIETMFKEGTNTIWAYAQDLAGNIGSSAFTFTTYQTAFVSTWDTSKAGITASNQINLPLEEGGEYNFTVEWGDGKQDKIIKWNQIETNHTYVSEGTYNVIINGTIKGWRFNNEGDKRKLLEISRWGCLQLGNSGDYFYGCSNLKITATDILNLTGTTTLRRCFYGCGNITTIETMNEWDTSNVESMRMMFYYTPNFNQEIGDWNTSKVKDMAFMFYGAYVFNKPISDWDTSKVDSMYYMFYGARDFNQSLEEWNTSSVTDMSYMFLGAHSFNQALEGWNTWKVTDMRHMFDWAFSFNESISSWNTSSVTDMNHMFYYATKFNQNISKWDTSKVEDMSYMFYNADVFNQSIANWNTSSVIYMNHMFYFTDTFNQNISKWNISNVKYMNYMFGHANAFNQSLENWNTSSVTTMQGMFSDASAFNQNITAWDVKNVIYMSWMFNDATAFKQNISCWNVSSVTTMENMFQGVKLPTEIYSSMLIEWVKLDLQTGVLFHGGTSQYIGSAAIDAHNLLTKSTGEGGFGWTITDGGLEY